MIYRIRIVSAKSAGRNDQISGLCDDASCEFIRIRRLSTYTAKMLAAEEMRPALTDEIRRAKADAKSESDVASRVQREAVRMLLREFEPLYSAHPGREGFVSLQGDPYLEHDPQNIIDEALLDRKMGVNLIAKIPPR